MRYLLAALLGLLAAPAVAGDLTYVSGNPPGKRFVVAGSTVANVSPLIIKSTSTTATYLPFRVITNAEAPILVTEQDGRVGIGTSAPTVPLHVVGTIISSAAAPSLELWGNGSNSNKRNWAFRGQVNADGDAAILYSNAGTDSPGNRLWSFTRSGLAGLGSIATAPPDLLSINETGAFKINIGSAAAATNYFARSISMTGTETALCMNSGVLDIYCLAATSDGQWSFYNATDAAYRMVIDAAGGLAIGGNRAPGANVIISSRTVHLDGNNGTAINVKNGLATIETNGNATFAALTVTSSNLVTSSATTDNASFTAFTQQVFNVCVTTITVTTTGSPVILWFNGAVFNDTANNNVLLNVLMDGAFISPYSATLGMALAEIYANNDRSTIAFSIPITPSAGSHSFCLAPKTTGNNAGFDITQQILNRFGVTVFK